MTVPRKGACRRADISADVLAQLNRGEIEALTLSESLAIDFATLAKHTFPELPKAVHQAIENGMSLGIVKRMELLGLLLLEHVGFDQIDKIREHPCDTVRGWACYVIGMAPKLTIKQRLQAIQPFADDPHYGVREWAWIAVRPALTIRLEESIDRLALWTSSASVNIRRFAAECLRPRGVWCKHIEELKTRPHLGLPLLEPLYEDAAKYVQDSVANWLNDASKTDPDWVREVCQLWQRQSASVATVRIVKRALRSV